MWLLIQSVGNHSPPFVPSVIVHAGALLEKAEEMWAVGNNVSVCRKTFRMKSVVFFLLLLFFSLHFLLHLLNLLNPVKSTISTKLSGVIYNLILLLT